MRIDLLRTVCVSGDIVMIDVMYGWLLMMAVHVERWRQSDFERAKRPVTDTEVCMALLRFCEVLELWGG